MKNLTNLTFTDEFLDNFEKESCNPESEYKTIFCDNYNKGNCPMTCYYVKLMKQEK